MTVAKESSSSVAEQNRLLSQLLSLFPLTSSSAKKHPSATPEDDGGSNKVLVQVSDQVPAGRGLVFTQPVEPEQVLMRLPPEALINVKSFSTFFRPDTPPNIASIAASVKKSDHRLSSAQLLSLLLARTKVEEALNVKRGSDATTTRHEALKLFVKTLPTSFDTVPLTWSLHARGLGKNGESTKLGTWKQRIHQILLQALPQHSHELQLKVRQRFDKDWAAICSMRSSKPDMLAEPPLLTSNPDLARDIVHSIDQELFLWSWLCVNSRCVFLPLGLAEHADNFTLAPMLDMANHTPDPALECKVNYTKDGGLELSAPCADQQTLAERKSCVGNAGDECFITYGPHSNECLLSEYGFVLPSKLQFTGETLSAKWKGSRYVDIQFDKEVEALLTAQGKEGKAKIELLQNRGYWEEFTIHPYPEPAHPSHRLIPALRLAALGMNAAAKEGGGSAPKVAKTKAQPGVKSGKKLPYNANVETSDLAKWEETLTGYREKVSDENEERAHAILVDLCNKRRRNSEQARQSLAEAEALLFSSVNHLGIEQDQEGWARSLALVKQLHNEEEVVLWLVGQAAKDQVEW
ncbi:hypothetical protein NDA13_000496 [Ustilago tritici]|nr:hypothetical protein NDA13_000496 [Ustilago tritici]